MNAIIATAITHHCHLNTSYRPTVQPEYYWNRAISLYRQNLHGTVDEQNMDVMISTCMMLAVHSFHVYDQTGGGSWAFADQRTPNWLNIHGGLPAVRHKCQGRESSSMWHAVFDDGDAFRDAHVKSENIDPAFAELCGIDGNGPDAENNPYYAPLQTLSALKKIKTSSHNLSKLLIFVGCARGEYRYLVAMKDRCALLILGFWFALLCNVDQW